MSRNFLAALALLALSAGSAGAVETANVLSPIRGLVRLDFSESRRMVDMSKTLDGRRYVWRVRNGATGALLQGEEGRDCPRYRQFVRLTPRGLSFGWNNLRGHPVARRWVAKDCFEGGKRCPLYVQNF